MLPYLPLATKTIIDFNNTNLLNNTLPIIITSISKEDAVKAKRFSPVEEHRIAIELDDNDKKEYDKQTAFINNSMTVIGNIENIKILLGHITLPRTRFQNRLRQNN